MTKSEKTKKFNLKMPTSFTIIFILMILVVLLSWIGFMGNWTGNDAAGDTVYVSALGITNVFPAIWSGFTSASDVILFVLAIGGTLGIMTKIKSIDAGIEAVVTKLQGKEIIMIPILMIIFGLGGTSYGMWEETIAFFPVLIPVFIKAGYGPIPATMTILLGAGAGCMASTVNPFLSIVAADEANNVLQGWAATTGNDVEAITSGSIIGSMMLSWVIFEGSAIAFTMWTATRIKNGKMNFTVNEETIKENFGKTTEKVEFTRTRKITLWLFISLFIMMIILILPWADWIPSLAASNELGTKGWDKSMFWFASTPGWDPIGWWWLISLSGLFLFMTIIIFIVAIKDEAFNVPDMAKEEVFVKEYINGAKDLLSVALVIGVAAGLKGLLLDSNIGTILASSVSGSIGGSMIGYGILIFFMSCIISFFIPSTSGFSRSILPIFVMAGTQAFGGDNNPQMAAAATAMTIISFTFAIGVVNFITPTSGALMGYTSFAGLNYTTWLKAVWKYVVGMLIVAIGLIVMLGAMAQGGTFF